MLLKYCMELANGQSLCLVGTNGIRSWLGKLASVIELGHCETNVECPRIIFIQYDLNKVEEIKPTHYLDSDMQSSLPSSGWIFCDYISTQFWFHPDSLDIICNVSQEINYETDIIRMWHTMRLIYRWSQSFGCIPLHAALVEKDGVGVVLAAQGGTGKSTCCRRIPSPWHALCDDEVLVVPDKHGHYMVHPFPTWSDYLIRRQTKTWNIQQYVPLSSIFFLDRLQSDQVITIKQGKSALYINNSSDQIFGDKLRDSNQEEYLSIKKKSFDNSCQIAKTVPVFKLQISLDSQFWKEIEKVLENV